MDLLAVQTSLTVLEDRYRDLQEIGEKRYQAWDKEKLELQEAVEDLKMQLEVKGSELQKVLREHDALKQQLETIQSETKDAREESELMVLQLHQIQEELEYHFLLSRHQDELLTSYSDLQQRIAILMADSKNTHILD